MKALVRSVLLLLLVFCFAGLAAQKAPRLKRVIREAEEGQVVTFDSNGKPVFGEQAVRPYVVGLTYPDSALVNVNGVIYRNILDADNSNAIPGTGWEYVVDPFEKYKSRNPFIYKTVDSIGLVDQDIVFIGASRVEGRRSPGVFKRELISRPDVGEGGAGFVAFGSTVTIPGLSPSVSGGVLKDATDEAQYGSSMFALVLDDATDTYTITSSGDIKGYFTDLSFWYLQQPGGGSFTLKVDGSTVATINTSGTLSVQKHTISSVSDAGHTVVWESTGGGDVVLTDYIVRRDRGTTVHMVGNGGVSASTYLANWQPQIYEHIQPNLVIIRLGINGSGISDPEGTSASLVEIVDSIRSVSPNTEFIITGETDNGTVNTQAEVRAFNVKVKKEAETNGIAFANLYELVPDWPAFEAAGLGDACCHELAAGAEYIGSWYLNYLYTSTYQPSGSDVVISGSPLKLANYDANGDLLSVGNSNIVDGNVIFNDGENTSLLGFANSSDPTRPRLSIANTGAGYSSLIFGGQYNGGLLESTITGSRIKLIESEPNEITFDFSDDLVAQGDQAAAYTTPLTIRYDEVITSNLSPTKINIGTSGFSEDALIYALDPDGVEFHLRDNTSDASRYAGIRLQTGSGSIYIRNGREGSVTSNFSMSVDGSGLGGFFTYERAGNIGLLTDNPSDKIHLADQVRVDGKINMTTNIIDNLGTPTDDDHAATKLYVDNSAFGSGDADADANEVTNAADATSATALTTLQQVQALVGETATTSLTTDANGDITITHGLGVIPSYYQITVDGSLGRVGTPHNATTTNFQVRVYNALGAPLTNTAVIVYSNVKE